MRDAPSTERSAGEGASRRRGETYTPSAPRGRVATVDRTREAFESIGHAVVDITDRVGTISTATSEIASVAEEPQPGGKSPLILGRNAVDSTVEGRVARAEYVRAALADGAQLV